VIHAVTASAALLAKAVRFEPETLVAVKVVDGASPDTWEGDLLVVAVTEEDLATNNEVTSIKSARLQSLSAACPALADCVAAGSFEGKQGQKSKVLRVGGSPGVKAQNVVLVGLGKAGKAGVLPEWGSSCWQMLGNAVATLAKEQRAVTAAVLLLEGPSGGAEADQVTAVAHIATGVMVGGFESSQYRSKTSPTASKLTEVHIMGPGATSAAAAQPALVKAAAVAHGTGLTRYLVEAPPNVCTPNHLALAAAHIAALSPATMKLEVLEQAECEALGMGLFLGVSEASDEPPKFIHLTYTSPGEVKKKIAVIGKGVTFDSGGYNIKAGPGSMIELMKFDMGGAGATLGAARIFAALAPPGLEVHFLVAACENMVAGHGLRPGDVLTSAAGKTVEVNNTDAEGRLTLADALWFAQEKCGVSAMVDSATLTGACIIALGPEIAAMYASSDTMASSVAAAAKAAGEKIWRMPLENNYWEQMKSSCADMKNAGGRGGGSITGALFLKQYVKDGVEWAHIDMAGPVWDEKAGLPTGFGAATLAEWAASQAK